MGGGLRGIEAIWIKRKVEFVIELENAVIQLD